MVKNPLCNAGDVCLIPSGGTKIPHSMEQVGPSAATAKPGRLDWRVFVLQLSLCCNERSCMTQQRSHVPQLRPDAAKLINPKRNQTVILT